MELTSEKLHLPTEHLLSNIHLRKNKCDYLHHFGLATDDNLVSQFKDVKFVCMGGKRSRMLNFAQFMYQQLDYPTSCVFEQSSENSSRSDGRLKDISKEGERYSLFKVGPVLSASHGIGVGSASIALHEILKLIHYAGCSDVTFIRIGTSGGLGLEPGTVVVTNEAYNGYLQPYFEQFVCGKRVQYDTTSDSHLAKTICATAKAINIEAVWGNTLTANDFYEEQARLDGALCSFTKEERMNFLLRAHHECGISNMEMEAACFIATCKRAHLKCAVICVTLVDRLKSDVITNDVKLVKKWERYPQEIAARYIKQQYFQDKE